MGGGAIFDLSMFEKEWGDYEVAEVFTFQNNSIATVRRGSNIEETMIQGNRNPKIVSIGSRQVRIIAFNSQYEDLYLYIVANPLPTLAEASMLLSELKPLFDWGQTLVLLIRDDGAFLEENIYDVFNPPFPKTKKSSYMKKVYVRCEDNGTQKGARLNSCELTYPKPRDPASAL